MRCAFCREPVQGSQEKADEHEMKRAEANDPVGLFQVGARYKDEGNYEGAFKYFTKAATLGEADAHYNLHILYRDGKGVEKNEKKKVYHLEEAAIGGHHIARHNLGVYEWEINGRIDRAMRHFIISAKLGCDESLEEVKRGFRVGKKVSKEDFEAALRGHQAAVDATKSQQRDLASLMNM
jgi:TPR repeat protein